MTWILRFGGVPSAACLLLGVFAARAAAAAPVEGDARLLDMFLDAQATNAKAVRRGAMKVTSALREQSRFARDVATSFLWEGENTCVDYRLTTYFPDDDTKVKRFGGVRCGGRAGSARRTVDREAGRRVRVHSPHPETA